MRYLVIMFCAVLVTILGLSLSPSGAVTAVSLATTSALVSYDCGSQGATGLQSAEDSLQSGGTLIFSGVCTGDLTLQPGTTLEGNNAAATIQGSVIYNGNGGLGSITIRSIHVSCGTANACLDIRNGWHSTIENVYTGGGTYGIELSAPTCVKGSGCNVNDYLSGNFISGVSQYGFYVNDPANTITDGHFDSNWVSGGVSAIYVNNGAGWFINNNHTYGNSGDGIHVNRAYSASINNNLLENGDMSIVVTGGGRSKTVIESNRIEQGGIVETQPPSGGNGQCMVAITGNLAAVPLSASGNTNCAQTIGLNLP